MGSKVCMWGGQGSLHKVVREECMLHQVVRRPICVVNRVVYGGGQEGV